MVLERDGVLYARDLNELHSVLTLLPRQDKQCKDCTNHNPGDCSADTCAKDQVCYLKVPGDCTTCSELACIAADSEEAGGGTESKKEGPNIGAIVGGVIGGLVVLAIAAFLVWKYFVKPRRTEEESLYYQESQAAGTIEKGGDSASRTTRPPSTHTVHSIASTVLTRASNIIQIAYIPGVTNRTNPSSPAVLVPPVPPIPMQHAEGNRGDDDGPDDQHFFVPGALRDSTYSGLSGYSDRTSYATHASYAPRSSIASTIYGKSAHVFTSAQAGTRAKPTMVSVKSTGETTPPVPTLDVDKFGPLRPQSTASTFSVGSTFLNNASTATAAPVRAQVVKVGGGPQVVKVGSGLKKVDVTTSSSNVSSASSMTDTSVAELPGDMGSPTGSRHTIIDDSPAVDQGPFSDPPNSKSGSSPALGVVMEDYSEEEDNAESKNKGQPSVRVTPVQTRGTSPFGDEHATQG